MIEIKPKHSTIEVIVAGHVGTIVTVDPPQQPVSVEPSMTVATGPAGPPGVKGDPGTPGGLDSEAVFDGGNF